MDSLLTPAGAVLVALVVASIVGFVAFVWAWANDLRPQPSTKFSDDAIWEANLVGSAMWRVGPLPWRVTAPMAKLVLGRDGLRIGPNRGFGFVMPTWEFRWTELQEVRQTGGGWTFVTREKLQWLRFVPAIGTDRTAAERMLVDHLSSNRGC